MKRIGRETIRKAAGYESFRDNYEWLMWVTLLQRVWEN